MMVLLAIVLAVQCVSLGLLIATLFKKPTPINDSVLWENQAEYRDKKKKPEGLLSPLPIHSASDHAMSEREQLKKEAQYLGRVAQLSEAIAYPDDAT